MFQSKMKDRYIKYESVNYTINARIFMYIEPTYETPSVSAILFLRGTTSLNNARPGIQVSVLRRVCPLAKGRGGVWRLLSYTE